LLIVFFPTVATAPAAATATRYCRRHRYSLLPPLPFWLLFVDCCLPPSLPLPPPPPPFLLLFVDFWLPPLLPLPTPPPLIAIAAAAVFAAHC
jgi:hypothetical protein